MKAGESMVFDESTRLNLNVFKQIIEMLSKRTDELRKNHSYVCSTWNPGFLGRAKSNDYHKKLFDTLEFTIPD